MIIWRTVKGRDYKRTFGKNIVIDLVTTMAVFSQFHKYGKAFQILQFKYV